jgi:hypothetical protein
MCLDCVCGLRSESFRWAPARLPTCQHFRDHLHCAGIGGATSIRALALGLIAARAGDGQIARVIGVVLDKCTQCRRRALSKPCVRNHVLQRTRTMWFAFERELQSRAAMQTARFPALRRRLSFVVMLEGAQEKSTQSGTHSGQSAACSQILRSASGNGIDVPAMGSAHTSTTSPSAKTHDSSLLSLSVLPKVRLLRPSRRTN